MLSGVVMEENHHSKKTGTVSRNCLLQTSLWHVPPQTFKQDKFSKWVTMLNCHSCAYALTDMAVNTRALSVLY